MKHYTLCLMLLFAMSGHLHAQTADSVILKDAVLYYYTYGKGEPLIILSGGPGVAAHQEDDVAERLGRRYQVILFDQRGTGRSWTRPMDSTTINVERAIADLEILRKHLHIQQLNLYGHSWGAMLAAGYISKYPRQVKLLIAVCGGELDTVLTGTVNANVALKTDQAAMKYWRDPSVIGKDSARAAMALRRLKVLRAVYDTTKVDAVFQQVNHGSTNAAVAALMWQSLRRDLHFIEGDRRYRGKALVIFGWNDMVSLTTATQYAQAFPQAEVKGIYQCGHYPEIEQPVQFYQLVEKYISRQLAGGRH